MKRLTVLFLSLLLVICFAAAGAGAETVMEQAKRAGGFEFSGKSGKESNREGRMAHNIYVDPDLSGTSGKFKSFSIEFLAEDAPLCTYWALCNWQMDTSSLSSKYTVTDPGGAYMGLQVTTEGNKGIMSFWEIHYLKNGVDTVLNATRIYPESAQSRFTGEGEGSNYLALYPWKENHWYRMAITCSDDSSGNTIVDQVVLDLESGEWTVLSRFDTGLQHSYLTGSMSQFMENYAGEYSNEFRSFRYRNIWVQEYGTEEWKPVSNAWLSTDTWWDNKKGYFAFGADSSSVWGITCGYGVDIIKTNPNVTTGMYCSVPHE